MRLNIRQIMTLLNVNKTTAEQIEQMMDEAGYLDNSECTQKEFNAAVKSVYKVFKGII